ncbi:MAG TPA: hypothetical protein VMS23_05200 [Terrimicrobiaceae bacterium]|nr:hypothetical protein [Terrimicrobiaceae bacterium]
MKARLEDSALGKAAGKLSFEPHRLRLDHTGRYEEALDREFPFLIKLFRLRHNNFTPVQSWYERLELFMPLDGVVCMVMGERRVDLAAGELLVVENMKMHRLVDAPGLDTRVIVMSFLPNFVYSLGSPSHAYFFLLPFFTNTGNRVHVVRDVALLKEIHRIISRLLGCYFDRSSYFQIGCKAFFLEIALSSRGILPASRFSALRTASTTGTLGPAQTRSGVRGATFRGLHSAQESGVPGENERATVHQGL